VDELPFKNLNTPLFASVMLKPWSGHCMSRHCRRWRQHIRIAKYQRCSCLELLTAFLRDTGR